MTDGVREFSFFQDIHVTIYKVEHLYIFKAFDHQS